MAAARRYCSRKHSLCNSPVTTEVSGVSARICSAADPFGKSRGGMSERSPPWLLDFLVTALQSLTAAPMQPPRNLLRRLCEQRQSDSHSTIKNQRSIGCKRTAIQTKSKSTTMSTSSTSLPPLVSPFQLLEDSRVQKGGLKQFVRSTKRQ
jgi:hypothetical protein